MKFRHIVLLVLVPLLLLAACRATTTPVTIRADGRIFQFNSSQRLPAELLSESGITLGANDRLLYLGAMIQPDQPLPDAKAYTLVVRRAMHLTLVTPDSTRMLSSSAQTVDYTPPTRAGFLSRARRWISRLSLNFSAG